jgi:UDP-4-amino-4,6-dideoxy-N-acetyl-beta-L-altrosamine transaminase
MTGRSEFLPYARQLIEDDDIAAVSAVLRGDWLTTGPAVPRFEAALAARTKAPFAVACANGTAALHLAALALGLGPGDAVVVPTVTFLATANAARFVGAEVVFADVDPDSGLLTAATLAEALARNNGREIRAVFPVHLNGQSCDMAEIAALARRAGCKIVEDACHALGTAYGGRGDDAALVGECRHAELAAFSFHAVKAIAMGEGGAVTARDPALAERVARFRSHGMVREGDRIENASLARAADGSANPWYYEMPEIGYNYRATDIQCALGLSQLAKLDRFAAARRDLVAAYDAALAPLAPLVRPIARRADCAPVWHLYAVLIDFERAGADRATVMRRLAERGIGTQVHYIPVHKQPYYRRRYGDLALPGADRYYARCLSLPFFAAMTQDDARRVAAALAAALGRDRQEAA